MSEALVVKVPEDKLVTKQKRELLKYRNPHLMQPSVFNIKSK